MQSRSSLYKKIFTELDLKRTAAQRERNERREKIYKAVPKIEEIDRQINIFGAEAAKNAALNPDKEFDIYMNLKSKTAVLTAQKEQMLEENGFSADMLKIHYSCEKCKDTGFVDGKMCICFSQRLMDLAYNSSGIAQMGSEGGSFEDFRIEYYPPQYMEQMQAVYNAALKFAENMGKESQNMIFYGNTGLGKTFLCTAIAKEAVKKGFTVMYVTSPQLFKTIEDERFGREEYEEEGGYMRDIMEADLMIIDDLGTEFATSFTSSELFNIINSRILEKKPVIISTNLSLNDIKEKYGERISSRIIGGYGIYKFEGEDIRFKKVYGRY